MFSHRRKHLLLVSIFKILSVVAVFFHRFLSLFVSEGSGFKAATRKSNEYGLRPKYECCDRTNNVTVILAVAVRVAIAEAHDPRDAAVALSDTPVVTAGTQIDVTSAVASV
jgi:hypothetical protein